MSQLPARSDRKEQQTAPRYRLRKRRVLWLAATVVILALLLSLFTPLLPVVGGERVLILGVDRRPGDNGRSDSMILAAVHPLPRGLALVAIPRDSRVTIPGRGTDKINAAYAYGGDDLAVKTAGAFLDLPLHEFIRIDYQGLVKVIDAMGGITLTVDEAMNYDDPTQNLHIHLKPGQQHLTGLQAMGYVRFRHDAEGDIARSRRQQQFLQAAFRQLLLPTSWPRLPAVWRAVRATITTNLNTWRLLRFGASAMVASRVGVQTAILPGHDAMVGGISYWIPDTKGVARVVKEDVK